MNNELLQIVFSNYDENDNIGPIYAVKKGLPTKVLTPILRNIVLESLIHRFNNIDNIYTTTYIDDRAIQLIHPTEY